MTDGQPSDPLPHALALTVIIIVMDGFSFMLGMLYIFAVRHRTADVSQINQL